ncbi:MAG: pseudouridine synthase [Acutalibacteraceae bacterium]
MKKERIDKLIASQSLLSRNDVKTLLRKGEITVNGDVVKDASFKASYDDLIVVNGEALCQSQYTYIMLNKPKGVVSATDDKRYKTVVDILPDGLKRKNLFPAGRLDKDTTGFSLITDDGEFAHNILAPGRHVSKTYIAEVSDKIDFESARKVFNDGVVLKDGTVLLSAELYEIENRENTYKVVIKEGKYHQIKRMFASLGTNVVELKRIAIGGLFLDDNLPEGSARLITKDELNMITE